MHAPAEAMLERVTFSRHNCLKECLTSVAAHRYDCQAFLRVFQEGTLEIHFRILAKF